MVKIERAHKLQAYGDVLVNPGYDGNMDYAGQCGCLAPARNEKLFGSGGPAVNGDAPCVLCDYRR